MFAGPQSGEKISDGVKYKNFNISSPQNDSRAFDISSGTRGNLVSCDTVNVQNKKRKTSENNPADVGCRDEICSESGQDISNDSQQHYESIQFGSTSPIPIDNSSLVHIDQKSSSRISDSEAYKGPNVDDVLAVAGPSGLQGIPQHMNLPRRNWHSNYVSEIPCERMREQYVLTCKVCKKEVGKHLVNGNMYRCCVCKFNALKQVYLQMHSYTHCHQKTCNMCGREYREGNLHDSEHTCDFCGKVFHCRTRYGEHLIDHPTDLKEHCWACSKHLSHHWIIENEEKIYACCFCKYDSNKKIYLRAHNTRHCPSFYCGICREEHRKSEKSLHGGNFTCLFCLNNYQCQTQLEEHTRREHDDFFYLHCRLCRRRIEKHITREGGRKINECCKCHKTFSSEIALQRHLDEHTNLRLFKCDSCGERFKVERQANVHLGKCVVFKCEVCGATFPSSGHVDVHHSVVHIQI